MIILIINKDAKGTEFATTIECNFLFFSGIKTQITTCEILSKTPKPLYLFNRMQTTMNNLVQKRPPQCSPSKIVRPITQDLYFTKKGY